MHDGGPRARANGRGAFTNDDCPFGNDDPRGMNKPKASKKETTCVAVGLGILAMILVTQRLYVNFSNISDTQLERLENSVESFAREGDNNSEAWAKLHAGFIDEGRKLRTRNMVKANNKKKNDGPQPGLDLVLIGDSITEAWRGTSVGEPCYADRCEGIPEVFQEHFGDLKSFKFAIGGDQTGHLLWRIKNGEISGLHPRVFTILIGTNDLGKAYREKGMSNADVESAVPSTVKGIEAVVAAVRLRAPRSHIVLMGLLPRGERHGEGLGGIVFDQPSPFTKAISKVNAKMQAIASKHKKVQYLDCGVPFLTEDGKAIRKDFMRDALHPTALGHKKMAECISAAIKSKLQGRILFGRRQTW